MKPVLNPSSRTILIVMIGLSLLVLVAYGPLSDHDFIYYDDPSYVMLNGNVQGGISFEGFLWAFRTTSVSNWHPLTWLSHMLDWESFGANAGGHHWTSLILHWGNGLLLFWVLFRMTASLGRSALVAALFLIHPLHVESVAWVSERKDVLSGLFWMLGLWAYLRYVERPGLGRYGALWCLFLLGLLSKPMVVTLPFVLLLLDWWPLRRLGATKGDWQPCLWEKSPLFLLSAASSVVTFLVQQAGEAVASLGNLPFHDRLANAAVAYSRYLIKTFWPIPLAVFYPHPGQWPLRETVLALTLLCLITSWAVLQARHRPYGIMGWLWFLGTLVPVIGLVQVGGQAMADRYTYLPLIGVFVALVWGMGDLFAEGRGKRTGQVLALLLLLSLSAVTYWQVRFWRNSETLFTRALEATERNFQAHNILGKALAVQGRYGEAEAHYRRAMSINPSYMPAYNNFGVALMEQGFLEEAEIQFEKALALKPGDGSVHFNRGQIYSKQGQWGKAVEAYRLALDRMNDNPSLYNNLGSALIHLGNAEEAAKAFRMAIRLSSGHAGAHNNLAMILVGEGRLDEAAVHFRKAIATEPRFANAHYRLGRLLIRQGKGREGETHLRLARELSPEIERSSD